MLHTIFKARECRFFLYNGHLCCQVECMQLLLICSVKESPVHNGKQQYFGLLFDGPQSSNPRRKQANPTPIVHAHKVLPQSLPDPPTSPFHTQPQNYHLPPVQPAATQQAPIFNPNPVMQARMASTENITPVASPQPTSLAQPRFDNLPAAFGFGDNEALQLSTMNVLQRALREAQIELSAVQQRLPHSAGDGVDPSAAPQQFVQNAYMRQPPEAHSQRPPSHHPMSPPPQHSHHHPMSPPPPANHHHPMSPPPPSHHHPMSPPPSSNHHPAMSPPPASHQVRPLPLVSTSQQYDAHQASNMLASMPIPFYSENYVTQQARLLSYGQNMHNMQFNQK